MEALVSRTQQLSQFCPTTSVNFPLLRDPDDTMILATANAAKTNVIVTGDLDLLILSEFKGIQIFKPIDFISSFKAQKSGLSGTYHKYLMETNKPDFSTQLFHQEIVLVILFAL